jgi:hypothetical protein
MDLVRLSGGLLVKALNFCHLDLPNVVTYEFQFMPLWICQLRASTDNSRINNDRMANSTKIFVILCDI